MIGVETRPTSARQEQAASLATTSTGPFAIASRLTEALGAVVGEPLLGLANEALKAFIGTSCPPAVVPVCAEILSQVDGLTSTEDFRVAKASLDTIVEVGELAHDRGVSAARQLLFDAIDKRVHHATFMLPASRLKACTDQDLHRMASLIVENGKFDRALAQRYFARYGDVLKIRSSDDPGLNKRALETLRKAIELRRGQHHFNAGYHSIRSLAIVAAMSNVAPTEFDKIVRETERAIEDGHFTLHEVMHVRDGLAEANARYYEKTREDRYRIAALMNLEFAKKYERRAAEVGGTQVEFLTSNCKATGNFGAGKDIRLFRNRRIPCSKQDAGEYFGCA